MSVSIAEVKCALQLALLGAVTNNLRAVTVNILENHLMLYFFYKNKPSEEETNLSLAVSSKVVSNLTNIVVEVKRIILPIFERIPDNGIVVFHKSET